MTGTFARAASPLLVAGLGAAAGWAGHGWTTQDTQLLAVTANAVAGYETVTVEARHPVEVRAVEGAHLVQWMSNRLGPPITPPAQLMYGDDHGTRLTVYVQPMVIDGEEFRYTQKGDARTIVWAERRLAFVATGNLTEDRLMAVAYRVKAVVDQGAAP